MSRNSFPEVTGSIVKGVMVYKVEPEPKRISLMAKKLNS